MDNNENENEEGESGMEAILKQLGIALTTTEIWRKWTRQISFYDNSHCPNGRLNQTIQTDGRIAYSAREYTHQPNDHFTGGGHKTVTVTSWTWLLVLADGKHLNGSQWRHISEVIVTAEADPEKVLTVVALELYGGPADAGYLHIQTAQQARTWIETHYLIGTRASDGAILFRRRTEWAEWKTRPPVVARLVEQFGSSVVVAPPPVPMEHTDETRAMFPGSRQTVPEDLLDAGPTVMTRPNVRAYLRSVRPDAVAAYDAHDGVSHYGHGPFRQLVAAIWPL